MNALQSLTTGNEEEAYNTTALLRSTHEVETRIQEIYRRVPKHAITLLQHGCMSRLQEKQHCDIDWSPRNGCAAQLAG
jgi:hypothetical protein